MVQYVTVEHGHTSKISLQRHTTIVNEGVFQFETVPEHGHPSKTSLQEHTTIVTEGVVRSTVAHVTSLQCTQAEINNNPNTIVLTTTNAGFLDVTENMLESIKITRACPNITVIAEDKESYQALSTRAKSQPGLHVQRTDSGETTSEKLMVNTAVYNQLVNKRPAYVLSFLEKGYQVLFVDVDTYWFHDPLKNVQWDFDIAMHNEFTAPTYWFCDGFVYYKPTTNTIKFVKEWAHLLATKKKGTADQKVMNSLISNKHINGLKVKTLSASQFPDGHRYFKTKGWKEKNNDTIVVHLSYILGHDEKVKTLKKYGFWVIK